MLLFTTCIRIYNFAKLFYIGLKAAKSEFSRGALEFLVAKLVPRELVAIISVPYSRVLPLKDRRWTVDLYLNNITFLFRI